MDWVESITEAIRYIEDNLTNAISVDDVSNQVFISSSHFQRIFNAVTGITIGEYIRNRRLSLSAQDLLHANTKEKVIDIAMRYQYDTSESFSKAFTRFHGIPPSAVKSHGDKLKQFDPITITIFIQGGFNMSCKITELNIEDIAKVRKFIQDNANNDEVIEKLILDGELMYVVLEKVIDGTLDKKFIKIMIPAKTNAPDWEDFQTLLEIGVMDGELEPSDISDISSISNIK